MAQVAFWQSHRDDSPGRYVSAIAPRCGSATHAATRLARTAADGDVRVVAFDLGGQPAARIRGADADRVDLDVRSRHRMTRGIDDRDANDVRVVGCEELDGRVDAGRRGGRERRAVVGSIQEQAHRVARGEVADLEATGRIGRDGLEREVAIAAGDADAAGGLTGGIDDAAAQRRGAREELGAVIRVRRRAQIDRVAVALRVRHGHLEAPLDAREVIERDLAVRAGVRRDRGKLEGALVSVRIRRQHDVGRRDGLTVERHRGRERAVVRERLRQQVRRRQALELGDPRELGGAARAGRRIEIDPRDAAFLARDRQIARVKVERTRSGSARCRSTRAAARSARRSRGASSRRAARASTRRRARAACRRG